MLPERLSNELCSLRPKEDKLTFSAVFELNDECQVIQGGLVKRLFTLTIDSTMKRHKTY